MAHKVEKMVFAGATPWHGLGTNVSGLMTSHDALVKANLNWQVVKKPLFYSELSNHEHFSIEASKPVPNTFGVFRESDDGLIPLTRNGKSVGKVWTALQNADAFSFMDEILQTQEATIEVAGALGNGHEQPRWYRCSKVLTHTYSCGMSKHTLTRSK